MPNRHIIIGTAGHVDHGKTSLVKALTGKDCDTHPEEKKRGITINNGYAYLKTNDDLYLAFIDVPGHKKFVNTMVAGIFSIDFVILVIAADDGVMPQSYEHLQILSLLGITRGVIVITKIDVVSDDVLILCESEINTIRKNTFLDKSPIFFVSNLTGQGLEELTNYLVNIPNLPASVRTPQLFRMFIDRAFTIKGLGTIVTGTVLGGLIAKGASVFLSYDNRSYRIRHIRKHDQEVEVVSHGDRVALNIHDLDIKNVGKGFVASEHPIFLTKVLDATLQWVGKNVHSHKRKNFNATFLCGTCKIQARVQRLTKTNELIEGNLLVQIHLNHPGPFAKGDYYILRDTNNNSTFGGGVILDPSPLIHSKPKASLLEALSQINLSGHEAFIVYKVKQAIKPLNVRDLVPMLQVSEKEIEKLVEQSSELTLILHDKERFLVDKTQKEKIELLIQSALFKLIEKNSLRIKGFTIDEVISKISEKHYLSAKNWVELIAQDSDKIVVNKGYYKLPGIKKELSEMDKFQIAVIEKIFQCEPTRIFSLQEVVLRGSSVNIADEKVRQILRLLREDNLIGSFDGFFFASILVDQAQEKLSELFSKKTIEGISVAQFRDSLKTNRKTAILLFRLFEHNRLIERKGDFRFQILGSTSRSEDLCK